MSVKIYFLPFNVFFVVVVVLPVYYLAKNYRHTWSLFGATAEAIISH